MILCNFERDSVVNAGLVEGSQILDLQELKLERSPNCIDSLIQSDMFSLISSGPAKQDLPRIPVENVKLLPPVINPPKVFNLGLVFVEHVEGRKHEYPRYPVVSMKPTTSLIGHESDILLPRIAPNLVSCAVELCLVMGKKARHVTKSQAMDCIAGYTVFNDVVARIPGTEPPTNKIFDTFAPTGPFMVTTEEIQDPSNLRLTLKINGDIKEEGNTKDMIFDIPHIVSFISDILTLQPGDLIATGEPGFSTETLHEGDVVEAEVQKVGILRNRAKYE